MHICSSSKGCIAREGKNRQTAYLPSRRLYTPSSLIAAPWVQQHENNRLKSDKHNKLITRNINKHCNHLNTLEAHFLAFLPINL